MRLPKCEDCGKTMLFFDMVTCYSCTPELYERTEADLIRDTTRLLKRSGWRLAAEQQTSLMRITNTKGIKNEATKRNGMAQSKSTSGEGYAGQSLPAA